jgi:hypothetical protein
LELRRDEKPSQTYDRSASHHRTLMVELLLEKHVHVMVEPQPGLLVRTSDSIFAIAVNLFCTSCCFGHLP